MSVVSWTTVLDWIGAERQKDGPEFQNFNKLQFGFTDPARRRSTNRYPGAILCTCWIISENYTRGLASLKHTAPYQPPLEFILTRSRTNGITLKRIIHHLAIELSHLFCCSNPQVTGCPSLFGTFSFLCSDMLPTIRMQSSVQPTRLQLTKVS